MVIDRILRAAGDWPGEVALALAAAQRPIPPDPRLWPREAVEGDDPPRPAPDFGHTAPPRAAATLLLLYPAGDTAELVIPLTVRHAQMRSHAGEVSLPGGAIDPHDPSDQAAALREAEEEIGVPAASVRILGHLDEVWIPVSNYRLRPFVGALLQRPVLAPRQEEVAEVIEIPLRRLFEAGALQDEVVEGVGWRLRAGAYRWAGHSIWGATARTLSMLATVLGDPP